MKLLHIINLEKLGGAEKMFLQFINHHSNLTDIIVNIGKTVDDEILNLLSERKILNPNKIFNNSDLKYPSFLRKYILLNHIKKKNPDVVIVWDLVIKMPRKPKNCLMVHYDHGSSWRFNINHKTLDYFNKIDANISVSYASKRMLQEKFNVSSPICIVKNTLPKTEKIIDKLPPKANNITLGTASRLARAKAIEISILTTKELLDRGFNAKLIIAGKGPSEQELKDLAMRLNIQENVFLLGHANDLSDFYQSIDIYMSTPIVESFGLSCMEAKNRGIPCIYPLIDGQPEVLSNTVHGWGLIPKFPLNDYEKLIGYTPDPPEKVYDPINDKLITPMVIDYKECAEKISSVMKNGEYDSVLNNLKEKNDTETNFIEEIRNFLDYMVKI